MIERRAEKRFVVKSDEFSGLVFQLYKNKTMHLPIDELFNLYVEIAHNNSDIDKDELKTIIFNKFKEYGDSDKTILKSIKTISNVKETTKNIISAIENEDSESLKLAYEDIKKYEESLKEIESELYQDILPGIYNKKFLYNNYIEEDNNQFVEDTDLFYASIDNLFEITSEHGHHVGDNILKLINKTFNQFFQNEEISIVRYDKNKFLIFFKNESFQKDLEDKLYKIYNLLKMGNYVYNNSTIEINFNYEFIKFKSGETINF